MLGSFTPGNESSLKIYRINGKDYIYDYYSGDDILYLIDKETEGIREAVRVKSCCVIDQENAIIVEVNENMSDSDVMITNANGRIVGQGHVNKGEKTARIAMPTHTPGVYIVSFKKGNSIIESQNVFLK